VTWNFLKGAFMHDQTNDPSPVPASDCPLCRSIAGESEVPLDYPWVRTARACVLPALGHLDVGHMLVCTNDHVPSLGAADRDTARAVVDLSAVVIERIRTRLGHKCFIFEHGFRKDRSASHDDCSINHVHIHVTALRPEVVAMAAGLVSGFIPVADEEMHLAISSREEYLLARIGDSADWRVSPEGYSARSRHFLKALDTAMGGHHRWDEAVVDTRHLIAESKRLLFPEAPPRQTPAPGLLISVTGPASPLEDSCQ
jgi:diadenosine tetraphosphate (Ap4A) HIT family hydrolase